MLCLIKIVCFIIPEKPHKEKDNLSIITIIINIINTISGTLKNDRFLNY